MTCRFTDRTTQPAARSQAVTKICANESRTAVAHTSVVPAGAGHRGSIHRTGICISTILPIEVYGTGYLYCSLRKPDDGETLQRIERHLYRHARTDRDRREVKHVVPIGIEAQRNGVE
jgi:hypothetical protein